MFRTGLKSRELKVEIKEIETKASEIDELGTKAEVAKNKPEDFRSK